MQGKAMKCLDDLWHSVSSTLRCTLHEKRRGIAPRSRERIRQIEAKALRKLRHPSRSRKLKAFVDGVKEY